MPKPTPVTHHAYKYIEMEKHINEKFNVYIDDFAGCYQLPGGVKAPSRFLEWTKQTDGVKDMEDLCRIQKEENSRYVKLHFAYESERHKYEPPYQNFWHFILDDVFFGDIPNGCIKSMNFNDIKSEYAKEDWQIKILDMFIEEFGTETLTVKFNW
jgi:hypothetical protein